MDRYDLREQLDRIEHKVDRFGWKLRRLTREERERFEMAGVKETAALEELQNAIEALEAATDAAEAWNGAEDETDATALKAKTAAVAALVTRIGGLVGVTVNDPGTVIDGTTGGIVTPPVVDDGTVPANE